MRDGVSIAVPSALFVMHIEVVKRRTELVFGR
jgi:hypothetical protein